MKRFAAICIVGFVLGTAGAFAEHPGTWGIGVVGGGGMGGWGGALSLKAPQLPIYWAISADINGDAFGLGVRGDYYIIDKNLVTLIPDASMTLGWYWGFGGYVSLWGFDDLNLALGARMPIGLSLQFLKHGEVFIEASPQIGLQVLQEVGLHANFFNGALGARFWF
jgi:hypothetical protein